MWRWLEGPVGIEEANAVKPEHARQSCMIIASRSLMSDRMAMSWYSHSQSQAPWRMPSLLRLWGSSCCQISLQIILRSYGRNLGFLGSCVRQRHTSRLSHKAWCWRSKMEPTIIRPQMIETFCLSRNQSGLDQSLGQSSCHFHVRCHMTMEAIPWVWSSWIIPHTFPRQDCFPSFAVAIHFMGSLEAFPILRHASVLVLVISLPLSWYCLRLSDISYGASTPDQGRAQHQ